MAFGEGLLPPLVATVIADVKKFVSGMDEVVSKVQTAASESQSAGSKIAAAIPGALMTVGATATAVGGVLEHFSSPMEAAEARLKTSIDNTGGNFDALKPKIDATTNKMAGLGYGAADTNTALGTLTTGTGDTGKALDTMQTAADLARYKHISLSAAADALTRALAGNVKMLAQLGINVKAQNASETELKKATDEHTKAVEALSALQEKQGDSAQVAAAKVATANDAAAASVKAVRDAVANLATAQKDFATLAAGPSATAVEAGYIAIANAAKTTRDAQQKVIDAQKALDDLAAGPSADTQAQAQENVGKAQEGTQKAALSLSDAQANLQTLQNSGTATARQLQDAHLAIQDAQYGQQDAARSLTTAQAALAKLTTDSLPGSDAMKTASNNLADAQLAARSATDSQKDAVQKQADLYAASKPGSDAYAAAVKKVADAADAVTAAQHGADAATVSAVQEQITAKTSAEALAAAQKKVSDSAAAIAKANADIARTGAGESVVSQIQGKIHGQSAAYAETFAGKMSALKVHIENVAGAFGKVLAPVLVTGGPLLAGIGGVLQSGVIPKFASFGVQLVGTGALAVKTFAQMAAGALASLGSMIAEAAVTAAAWVADMAVMVASTIAANIAMIAATGGIILVVAAVAVGVYELWTHWSTVWGWIKTVASDAWQWIQHHMLLIMGIVAPFLIPFYELYKHWGEIWANVQGAFDDVIDALKVAWNNFSGFFAGIWNDIVGGIKSGINTGIDLINDFIKGAAALINTVLGIASHIPGLGSLLPSSVSLPLIPELAGGGDVLAGHPYIVGDAGRPELFVPGMNGTVLPQVSPPPAIGGAAGMPGAGGATVVNNYFTVEGHLLDTGGLADLLADPMRAALLRRGRSLTGILS